MKSTGAKSQAVLIVIHMRLAFVILIILTAILGCLVGSLEHGLVLVTINVPVGTLVVYWN